MFILELMKFGTLFKIMNHVNVQKKPVQPVQKK